MAGGNVVAIVVVLVVVVGLFVGLVLYLYAPDSPLVDVPLNGSSGFFLLSSNARDVVSYSVSNSSGVVGVGVLFSGVPEVVGDYFVNDSLLIAGSSNDFYAGSVNCSVNVSGENACRLELEKKAEFLDVDFTEEEIFLLPRRGVVKDLFLCFRRDYLVWSIGVPGVERFYGVRERFGFDFDECFLIERLDGGRVLDWSFVFSEYDRGDSLVELFVFDGDRWDERFNVSLRNI